MEQNVRYYWIQEQANHSCPRHIIYGANLYTCYQNLVLTCKGLDLNGHRIEIFTLVLEIHENVDLVIGIKNKFELEGMINSQESCFSFLNRSIPFFP